MTLRFIKNKFVQKIKIKNASNKMLAFKFKKLGGRIIQSFNNIASQYGGN